MDALLDANVVLNFSTGRNDPFLHDSEKIMVPQKQKSYHQRNFYLSLKKRTADKDGADWSFPTGAIFMFFYTFPSTISFCFLFSMSEAFSTMT